MTILLLLVLIVMRFFYLFLKLLPTRKKIVMMSRQSNKKSMDFELLGTALEKKYKVIYLCKTLEGKENSKLITAFGYGFHMFRQMYHLATSKVCIIDSYIPTVSILKHKKNLTVIQMWHSNGTMKKFGYTTLKKREGTLSKYAKILKMHHGYDIIFASGEAYKEHLALGFKAPIETIKVYSLPRIDLLKNKDYEQKVREKIFSKYPELQNSSKENVVYAPTFRKDESKLEQYVNDLIDSIDLSKYNLIVKLHPLSKYQVQNQNVIFDKDFSTFDMLFVTDKLISDYSCVIYEAGVRNIPLYFYAYDLSYYDFIRGLALDYNELPGYTERDAKLLAADLEKDYDYNYLKSFMAKYVENTENCTQKIVDLVDQYMDRG